MKYIKLFLVVGMAAWRILAEAQSMQVSVIEAEEIAEKYLLQNLRQSWPEHNRLASYNSSKGDTLLYEVIIENGMSVLVSGHKGCPPVLAYYNSNGHSIIEDIESNTLPINLLYFINGYIEQIEYAFERKDTTQYYIRERHNLLYNSDDTEETRNVEVGPLLTSQWGQSGSNDMYYDPVWGWQPNAPSSYNYFIPSGGTCEHALVGCVAVAMGQVMKYWQEPILTRTKKKQFDWCNIEDYLISTDANYINQRNAISYLLLECAKSVDMDFGCDGSTASMSAICDALKGEYGYSNDMSFERRVFYNNTQWKNKLKNDLDAGCPVIYAANRYAGVFEWPGHAFVCDGYRDNEFHFNWGWNGSYDGYFTLDSLCPNPDRFYKFCHEAIFRIYPRYSNDICDYSLHLQDFYALFYNESANNGIPPYDVTPQTMTSMTSASSTSPVAWRTIPAGTTAMYQAHEEIVLQDGFTVEAGAEFTAEIVPCPNCGNSRDATGNADGVAADEPAEIMAPSRRTPEPPQPQADLYPNPTSGEVTVSVEGEVQSVVILNMMGQPVGGWGLRAMEPGRVTIDVGPLPAGPYLVCVHTPHGTATKKLLVGTE